MLIDVIAVGRKMPAWINAGFEEYARRLSGDCRLKLTEIPAVKRSNANNPDIIRTKEAERIRQRIPKGNRTIALDEKGRQCTTRMLSDDLESWLAGGQDICCIIGGADGLDGTLIDEADGRLSLSKLTLPHGLVRVILAEQIYRAWSLLKNHPYHRD